MGMEHLGMNVRRMRQARRWTQQDLADQAGVSQQLVSAIEIDERIGRFPTLMKLAAAFGVPLDELTAEPAASEAGAIGDDEAVNHV